MFSIIELRKKEKDEIVICFLFLAFLESNRIFLVHEFEIGASQLQVRHIYSETPNPGDTVASKRQK